ncbi:MAG: HD domain-containing protein [Anaeromyxobacter sp.]
MAALDPVQLSPRFGEALLTAFRLHGRQERKGSRVPYMGHLLGAAALVIHFGGDEDQAIAALLHDAAEDQGGWPTLEAIEARFGQRVAHLVEACTDTFEEPKPAWRPRKEAYLARLATESKEVLLVSAADKLDNARAIVMDLRAVLAAGEDPTAFWRRFNGGREGSLWYYGELARTFQALDTGPIAAELAAAVEAMQALAAR